VSTITESARRTEEGYTGVARVRLSGRSKQTPALRRYPPLTPGWLTPVSAFIGRQLHLKIRFSPRLLCVCLCVCVCVRLTQTVTQTKQGTHTQTITHFTQRDKHTAGRTARGLIAPRPWPAPARRRLSRPLRTRPDTGHAGRERRKRNSVGSLLDMDLFSKELSIWLTEPFGTDYRTVHL
jgi:hypothetical protein